MSRYLPKLKLELQPQHHPEPPLIIEFFLEKGKFNVESEYVEGSIRLRETNL
jgi:hypothetical protein